MWWLASRGRPNRWTPETGRKSCSKIPHLLEILLWNMTRHTEDCGFAKTPARAYCPCKLDRNAH